MKYLLKTFKVKELFILLIVIGLTLISVYSEVTIPEYMQNIIISIKSNGTLKDIYITGAKMLGFAILSAVTTVGIGFCTSYLASTYSYRTRKALFEKVDSLSQAEIENFSVPSLVTRTTNDITQVQMLIAMGTMVCCKAPVMAVWALIKIQGSGISAWLLAIAVAIGFLVVVITILYFTCMPKVKLIQTQVDEVNNITRENINGIRVIKAFNAEDYQDEKFNKVNTNLTKTNTFVGVAMGSLNPVMSAVMYGLTLAISWIGAYAINDAINPLDKLELFANMQTFSSYAMQVIMSFMLVVMIVINAPRSFVSLKRIAEVLSSKSTIFEGSKENCDFNEGIEFNDVSFEYDSDDKTEKEAVLQNISFKIKKGSTFAIIGPTGSGKTTLVNLMSRIYDVNKGEIKIDGVNIKDYSFDALYKKLSLIPQKSIMFNTSIIKNIQYGENPNFNQENLDLALKVSCVNDVLASKENGLEELVEQGGKNLSGGQKQRISIARGLAKKPEVIIFDDSFSALDYKTDSKIRHDLKKYYPTLTKIIVAQRIGSIRDADQILVLDEGKIMGLGTHSELMSSCKTYQEIALSQLSKEEL